MKRLPSGARNFNDLSLLDGEEELETRIDVETQIFERRHRLIAQAPPIHGPADPRRMIVQKQVFRDGQLRDHHPTLVDAGDALAPSPAIVWGQPPDRLARFHPGWAYGFRSVARQAWTFRAVPANERPRIADRDREAQHFDVRKASVNSTRLSGERRDHGAKAVRRSHSCRGTVQRAELCSWDLRCLRPRGFPSARPRQDDNSFGLIFCP